MFHYTNEKDMKNFLDKNVVCKTKEDKKMLEQIKHYLDWPLQLYALQEAEFSLQDELRGKFDNLKGLFLLWRMNYMKEIY